MYGMVPYMYSICISYMYIDRIKIEPKSLPWSDVQFIFFSSEKKNKTLSIPLPLKKILCMWDLDASAPEDAEITFLFLSLQIEMWKKDRRATVIKEF